VSPAIFFALLIVGSSRNVLNLGSPFAASITVLNSACTTGMLPALLAAVYSADA
jgi:hypothetical protein